MGLKKSVSQHAKCLKHIVHRILDFEEIARKGINENEENFIGNWKLSSDKRFNNTHTYAELHDLQSLAVI